MKVTRAKLVDLFEALGYATARQWKKGEMRKRLAEVVEMAGTEGFVFENATGEQDGLLSALVEAKGEVELVSEAAELEPAAADAEPEQVADAGPEDVPDEGFSPYDADEEPEQLEKPAPEPPTKAGKKKRGGKKAKGKAKKEKAPKKAGTQKGPGRPKVLGTYSAGPFVRWLGRLGVGLDAARSVIDGEGCVLSDSSIGWELKETREKHPPAAVSAADEATLREKYPDAFGG